MPANEVVDTVKVLICNNILMTLNFYIFLRLKMKLVRYLMSVCDSVHRGRGVCEGVSVRGGGYGGRAGDTHPAGIHSCWKINWKLRYH